MILTLQRRPQDPNSTPGQLGVNGVAECFTLELPVRDGLPGSAIPAGTYPVVLEPSPKFLAITDSWVQQYAAKMPHIQPIPNRSLIMIHWGNTPENTDGCILVGQDRAPDYVGNSRSAFAALYSKIAAAVAAEGCTIQIFDCPNNAEDVEEAGDPG
jgi:hypothetical protein